MSPFGQCVDCGAEAVVGINGAYVCLDHFAVRLRAAQELVEPVGRTLETE